jgi:hypothetical protein
MPYEMRTVSRNPCRVLWVGTPPLFAARRPKKKALGAK